MFFNEQEEGNFFLSLSGLSRSVVYLSSKSVERIFYTLVAPFQSPFQMFTSGQPKPIVMDGAWTRWNREFVYRIQLYLYLFGTSSKLVAQLGLLSLHYHSAGAFLS